MGHYRRYSRFAPYVSVAERKRQAGLAVAKLKKQGQTITPVIVEGRTIAKTFWGKSWCNHLESYSDYDNRLPRGRTYVRNGSVFNLQIKQGEIHALVSGSSIYTVKITIECLPAKQWCRVVEKCAGKIDSLIELLQGKLSKGVMEIITCRDEGLFPDPKEIKLSCSCPDWATMCKHVAAVLYGIGARLDECPEELFILRQVDHKDLIASIHATSLATNASDQTQSMVDSDLSSLFGIEIAPAEPESFKQSARVKEKKGAPTEKPIADSKRIKPPARKKVKAKTKTTTKIAPKKATSSEKTKIKTSKVSAKENGKNLAKIKVASTANKMKKTTPKKPATKRVRTKKGVVKARSKTS